MENDRKPDSSTRRLVFQFLVGLIYFSPIALGVAEFTGTSFLQAYYLLTLNGLAISAIALVWLTLWATRKDSRVGQFGIGSIIFLTILVAIQLSFARCLVVLSGANEGSFTSQTASVCLFGVIVFLISSPFQILMTESLLWFSVWLIRRRAIRRFLAKSVRIDGKDRSRPPP